MSRPELWVRFFWRFLDGLFWHRGARGRWHSQGTPYPARSRTSGFAGTWQLPGGFAEHDEPLSLAVEREVYEEASVTAKVRDAIAFRHMHGRSTNIYMIFRFDYVSGEPTRDGIETANAGFFSLTEMALMEGVQNISRWGIEQALVTPPDSGLSLDINAPGADRRGWELFSLTEIDPEVWQPGSGNRTRSSA